MNATGAGETGQKQDLETGEFAIWTVACLWRQACGEKCLDLVFNLGASRNYDLESKTGLH